MGALGNNIFRIRTKQNMTQQELADKLFVTRQTVCRWEKETRIPDLTKIRSIAEVFDVSIEDLMNGESNITDRI